MVGQSNYWASQISWLAIWLTQIVGSCKKENMHWCEAIHGSSILYIRMYQHGCRWFLCELLVPHRTASSRTPPFPHSHFWLQHLTSSANQNWWLAWHVNHQLSLYRASAKEGARELRTLCMQIVQTRLLRSLFTYAAIIGIIEWYDKTCHILMVVRDLFIHSLPQQISWQHFTHDDAGQRKFGHEMRGHVSLNHLLAQVG